jgi:hypothetical protein
VGPQIRNPDLGLEFLKNRRSNQPSSTPPHHISTCRTLNQLLPQTKGRELPRLSLVPSFLYLSPLSPWSFSADTEIATGRTQVSRKFENILDDLICEKIKLLQ